MCCVLYIPIGFIRDERTNKVAALRLSIHFPPYRTPRPSCILRSLFTDNSRLRRETRAFVSDIPRIVRTVFLGMPCP